MLIERSVLLGLVRGPIIHVTTQCIIEKIVYTAQETPMKPEWSGNPEVGPTITIFLVAGALAFLMLVFLFAFYGF
jgi:hypothetical protein